MVCSIIRQRVPNPISTHDRTTLGGTHITPATAQTQSTPITGGELRIFGAPGTNDV